MSFMTFLYLPNPPNMYFLAQPESPAELGNKIYEMMAMAVGGRWGRMEENEEENESQENETETDSSSADGSETEVVEPSEVRTEKDPWSD